MRKALFIFLAFFTFIGPVLAGLPPTTSKVNGDASNITTFNYQFPNFSGTHTGTTVSLGAMSFSGLANESAYSVLGNNTASSAAPSAITSITLGAPSITDTGVASQFTGSVSGYYQSIWQNTSNNAAASTDLIVNNNLGTSTTYFGDFGINSSTFSGTGSFALPNATYVYSQSGDLVLGTYSSNALHLVTSNSATDALNISSGGTIAIPAFSTAGVLLNNASGQISSTAGALPIANGGTASTTSAAGTIPNATSSSAASWTASPTLGASGTTGKLNLSGSTSGTVTVQPQATAGTYNFNLPTTAGTTGQVLTSAGGSSTAMTWTSPNSIPAAWAASTAYVSGNLVTNGGNIYSAQASSFTSGSSFAADAALGYWKYEGRQNSIQNYATYGNDFEDNTVGGWQAVGCATVTNGLPACNGSGGAAFSTSNGGRSPGVNTSAAAVNSSALVDQTYSLNYATTGAGTIGDGLISGVYQLDAAAQAKVLTVTFDYRVNSGSPALPGSSSNTYAAALYDATNNAWLGCAGNFNIVQSSGVGRALMTCQTASNTVNIQLFVYSPVAPAGSSSFLIDNVVISRQTVPQGPAMTDWVAYTPTITGFGTPSSVNFYSRRVGANLEVMGTFVSGTNTAVAAQVTLGFNGANANVTSQSSGVSVLTIGKWTSSAANQAGIVISSSSGNYVSFGLENSSTPGYSFMNGNVVTNTATVSMFFSIPIAGWSSNTSMSADTDTRVVAMQVQQSAPTATITSSFSLAKFTSGVVTDTHGGFSTSTGGYTCLVTGNYRVTFNLSVAGTFALNQTLTVGVGKNSTSSSVFGNVAQAGGALTTAYGTVTGTIPCNAGDVLYPLVASNATTPTVSSNSSTNFFAVERLSGPAVIAATESVNASAYLSANQTGVNPNASSVKINPDTRDFDSHAAWDTTNKKYVVPVSGTYEVSVVLMLSSTNVLANVYQANIYKNGSFWATAAQSWGTASGNIGLSGSALIKLNAGDYIELYLYGAGNNSSSTLTVTGASNGNTRVMIKRVGN